MSENVCSICGGKAEAVREVTAVSVGRRSTEVEVDFVRCRDCMEEFFRPGQLDAAQDAASRKIRNEEGLLLPWEIKSLRDAIGLSQAGFEKLLGVGPKTVVRWEKGTVFQNAATDSLLRLLRANRLNVLILAKRHEVEIPPDFMHHGSWLTDQPRVPKAEALWDPQVGVGTWFHVASSVRRSGLEDSLRGPRHSSLGKLGERLPYKSRRVRGSTRDPSRMSTPMRRVSSSPFATVSESDDELVSDA